MLKRKKIGEDKFKKAFIEIFEGNIYLAKKDLNTAKKHFESALEANPELITPYENLARIYLKEGKESEAISKFEKILAKNPKYLPGYMALGTIYTQQNKMDKVESYYREALKIKKDFAPAANNLAWLIVEREGDINEALGFARIAKEKFPNDAAIMDTLGWIYYLKGDRKSVV